MLKWALRIFAVLILSLSVAAMLIKMRPRPARQTVERPAPLVEAVKVHKNSENMIIQAYGTVRSGEILNLTAEVRGKIVEMAPSFEEGNYFPKGAFLIRIDPSNYSLVIERLQSDVQRLGSELARIEQEKLNLQASLKISKEDLELAKAEYDRNLSLAKRDLVSQNQIDLTGQKWLISRRSVQELENSLALIKPRIDILKAQEQAVLIQLKEAQLDFQRTEIRAPFDARVKEKLVETGQYVNAGTRLASIYNVDTMEVEIRILPQDVVWFPFPFGLSGDSKNLHVDPPAKARINYNASGQKIFWDGFVSRIKGEMEETTRTMPLVVQILNNHPGPGHPLMPGMFVSVEIIGKKVDDLFLIPQEAVHVDNSVYVVEDGTVLAKPIKIFRRVGNQVYANEGLSEGDKVITRFPGDVARGMKVRVNIKTDQEGTTGWIQ